MSRQKIKRFADNAIRSSVIEPGKAIYEKIKGNWHSDYFKNQNDLVIELACGKGEYTVGLAKHFPERNFIGIDVKGDRIWVGSGFVEDEKINNATFLRTDIHFLNKFFVKNEVGEIWLTFPDPRPKDRDEKRRLTHPNYMGIYQEILKPEGFFKFKTDNTQLFEYTLELIQNNQINVQNLTYTFDLYNSPLLAEHHGITTKYERLFVEKGESIKYMKFKFVTE